MVEKAGCNVFSRKLYSSKGILKPAKPAAIECNDIETARRGLFEVAANKVGQPELGCSNNAFLFMPPNCFGRRAVIGIASTAYFDKYKYILVARNDIDFPRTALKVACEYA
nr:hypothetical protein [Neopusillimonas maritima]